MAREQEPILVSIQEGKHRKSPPNPALDGLLEIQNEMQDIVDGFHSRLSKFEREVFQQFAPSDGEEESPPSPASASASSSPLDESKVSIQPIFEESPAADASAAAEIVSAQLGIIGRDSEEISAALERAGEVTTSAVTTSASATPTSHVFAIKTLPVERPVHEEL